MKKTKNNVCVGCVYFAACGDTERTESCAGRKTRRMELEEEMSSIDKRLDNMFKDFPTPELRRKLVFETPQFDELVMEHKRVREELETLIRVEEMEVEEC